MPRFQWREQYDDENDAVLRELTDLVCLDPSLTDTSKAKDADLNEVMRRFGWKDGSHLPMAYDPRYYGDFTQVTDFREGLDLARAASEQFQALPADLRMRFGNDPAYLHDWVNDPKNQDEAVNLGLLAKRPADIPAEVRTRQQLTDWVSKPENRDEAIRIGLITPPTPPAK